MPDKFSVRYKCHQNVELDVNDKVIQVYHYSAWFFRAIIFLYVFKHVMSPVIQKL